MNHHIAQRGNLERLAAARDVTQDALVVVPGIMGSELRDAATGKILWGLSGARWLLDAWTSQSGLSALRMTEDELEGRTGRVKATQLLKHSAWTPHLRGFEPYSDLVAALQTCVPDKAAILEFAYDWRLSVTHNGRRLAAAARRHLTAWRSHPAHDAARRLRRDETPARLVFVAHSMGGLVTQDALNPLYDTDLACDTRGVITLGTPFYGAVKAVSILNSGRGTPVPLPHRKLQNLCATMPGLHDLLPLYACVLDGSEARRLTPEDVSTIGGDIDLARRSIDHAAKRSVVRLPGHHAIIGTSQETAQSLSIKDGMVHAHCHTARRHSDHTFIRDNNGHIATFDCQGDGTVSTEAATLDSPTTPLPLQHGAVAADRSARRTIEELVRRDKHLGPPMGGAGCGLSTPDLVEVGTPCTLDISGSASPSGVSCDIVALEGTARVTPPLFLRNRQLTATFRLDRPGLYRVTVTSHDRKQVSQLLLASPPEGRVTRLGEL
ncbi:hypothetical protein [Streptomyces sp. NPDC059168]|uniref:lipase/acyltransferase domain-containing protein n=1 Tax=Streptomyces sp. NPDC059168 TaxID=3346753 RepID=UPI0036D06B8F